MAFDDLDQILVTNFVTILVNFGVFLAVFWLLNETQLFTIDVGSFLDQFGVAFFIGLTSIQLINIGIQRVMRR